MYGAIYMNGTASMGSPSLIIEDSSPQQYVYHVKYSMYVWSHTEFPFTFSTGAKNSNHDSLIELQVRIEDDRLIKDGKFTDYSSERKNIYIE